MFDARALHEWLGVKDPFHQWVKRRVESHGFEEGFDFCTVLFKTPGKAGRPRTDYLITPDTAMHLALMENNEMGRKTRRYFIQMESAAITMAQTLAAQGQVEAIPQGFFDS